ncbi:MAG: DUF3566 domain-containing protein [Propionibacteriaceae bacterium]|jgi:hypothetical protein|nr:DUF3566 domain-containing protein [Propionibacteriaceae bacterium]
MPNLEPTEAQTPDESNGVGSRITRGFKNRAAALRSDQPVPTDNASSSKKPSGLKLSASRAEKAPAPRGERRRPSSRRARLRISRVDPWSVMKITLMFAVAIWIITIVATWAVFAVLDGTGLYDAINDTVSTIFTSPGAAGSFNIKDWVNTTRATAIAALIGAVNVVIMTALATIFSFLYNLAANVMGGIEVTLAED